MAIASKEHLAPLRARDAPLARGSSTRTIESLMRRDGRRDKSVNGSDQACEWVVSTYLRRGRHESAGLAEARVEDPVAMEPVEVQRLLPRLQIPKSYRQIGRGGGQQIVRAWMELRLG